MLKDQLSPELLAAIQTIVKNNRDQTAEERTKFAEAAQKRYGEIRPVSEMSKPHTVPKTDKEKKLAALADDGKKHVITHADVMVGRGVKKEETEIDEAEKKKASAWDAMAAAVKARREKEDKEKGTGKFDKKELAPGRMQYTRKSSTYSEEKDTPGQHQCAIHVKHSTMGEGKTLFSQHALPDTEGHIAWYDVMFEHGIEKQVPTSDLEILVSEAHMNHKKKKSM